MPINIPRYRCPDCGVTIGRKHVDQCDVERCSYCGGQALSCDCEYGDVIKYDRQIWTGFWPGEEECEHYGLFCVLIPGCGWVSCERTVKGAVHDLNRLVMDGKWNRTKQRWVIEELEVE